MISINQLTEPIVQEMIIRQSELEVSSNTLENKATIIDCGINVRGSYQAGIMYVQACLGGLATAGITTGHINGIPFPFLDLTIQHPAIACLGSQKAGWIIKTEGYSAMASGPARALALKPKKTYSTIGYSDISETAVIALESDRFPDIKTTEYIAEKCGIDPSGLTILIAPINSLVGSIQISARVATMVLHSLEENGSDLSLIRHATGRSPIAPVKKNKMEAMGTTNDCNIYYGSVCLTTEGYDPVYEGIISQSSPDYGRPFYRLFKEAGYDFMKIDSKLAFSPAEIMINDCSTGEVFSFGSLNGDVILESFGLHQHKQA
ncbi:methenyltetrahydromethanopterin cyclohydrolase [Methanoplanus endosymbiosus]|uniref:Methenyltetrahydromethanopterin cyclohydrolase n=1 Tax=Methanoplanus endosymbiosus TaxID=33865 RepID=A0A9E7PME6_9EURY|nr:methenyltetrahydromethanopterin cyclohydrolase [Methanoplanus endosymbiosus]UUX92888.1 methenyltetrahydromethanopterin cyclohydrolase [Methanoplanus endosymbiosus]